MEGSFLLPSCSPRCSALLGCGLHPVRVGEGRCARLGWRRALRALGLEVCWLMSMPSCWIECGVLYCILLHRTVLYCTVLYCNVWYCSVLYGTVRYCIVSYCTALFCRGTLIQHFNFETFLNFFWTFQKLPNISTFQHFSTFSELSKSYIRKLRKAGCATK